MPGFMQGIANRARVARAAEDQNPFTWHEQ